MTLTIRREKEKNLVLTMNQEKVFFVALNGVIKFNSLNYDEASNYYNTLNIIN